MTQETVIDNIRQRLGPLNNQAEQAVKEVLEMLGLPREMALFKSSEETFIGANVSPAEYEAWSREERLQYQTAPEKTNARWIERKMQELRAAWIMVIDGKVVLNGSLTDYPSDDEFDAFCEKIGKFPFVFINSRVLMIEDWQSSPFVAINPQRTALVGRKAFLKLQPVVHLDFASRQTELEYV